MEINYIYLLQEREFIKTNENIYKIGKTKQKNNDRLKQYPKGSILLFQMICNSCDTSEKELIEKFKKKYKHREDIGSEYFEGDYNDMINIIYTNISSLNEIKKAELYKLYMKKLDVLFEEFRNCEDDYEKELLEKNIKNLGMLMNTLKK